MKMHCVLGLMISLAGLGSGQSLESILPGDNRCTGSQQTDSQWGLAINNMVQVGSKMSCTLVVDQTSEYALSIIGFEPLLTAQVGTRVFDVIVNGEKKTGIDYTRYAGVNAIYEIGFRVVAASFITINFEATQRTAVWSRITIQKLNPTAIIKLQAQSGKPKMVIVAGGQVKVFQDPITSDDFPTEKPDDIVTVAYWKSRSTP